MKHQNKYSEWEYEDEDDQDDDQDQHDADENDQDQSDKDSGDDDQDPENKKDQLSDDTEVEVEIDGVKEKMTLAEIKKGYMRQSDYTRKTQELSEMSKKDQQKVIDKAQDVVDNKDDFPAEDVKTAEYLIKIAKSKFGLMTREEYESEKTREKQISEYDTMFKNAASHVAEKMKGMPKFVDEEVIEHMKKTGIHNALAAYKDLHDAEYRDWIIKQSKGNKSYRSDKGGMKPGPKEKEVNVRTEEGHRTFLADEIAKMKAF